MEMTGDHTAIITGASAGIGRALALKLAGQGVKLALIARRKEKLDQVVAEAIDSGSNDAHAFPADVGDRSAYESALKDAVDRFGEIDLLVNNAGIGHKGYVVDTPDDHIERVFRVNVHALWYGARVMLPAMIERGSGHILTISSFAGLFPFPGNSAYVAAKHAAIGFTRALRSELSGTGVEATVAVPAGVATDWATSTEGGDLLPLFEHEGNRAPEIARERGIEPAKMPEVQSAEYVADRLAEHIAHPTPLFHTHERTGVLAQQYLEDPASLEPHLAPYWAANQEAYAADRNTG